MICDVFNKIKWAKKKHTHSYIGYNSFWKETSMSEWDGEKNTPVQSGNHHRGVFSSSSFELLKSISFFFLLLHSFSEDFDWQRWVGKRVKDCGFWCLIFRIHNTQANKPLTQKTVKFINVFLSLKKRNEKTKTTIKKLVWFFFGLIYSWFHYMHWERQTNKNEEKKQIMRKAINNEKLLAIRKIFEKSWKKNSIQYNVSNNGVWRDKLRPSLLFLEVKSFEREKLIFSFIWKWFRRHHSVRQFDNLLFQRAKNKSLSAIRFFL